MRIPSFFTSSGCSFRFQTTDGPQPNHRRYLLEAAAWAPVCPSCGLRSAPSKAAALTPFFVAIHRAACERLTPDSYGGRGSTFRTGEATLSSLVLHPPTSQCVPQASPGLDSLGGGQLKKRREKFTAATVTRVIESVDHKHEQCCYVPGTARPTWTSGLGTEGLVSR